MGGRWNAFDCHIALIDLPLVLSGKSAQRQVITMDDRQFDTIVSLLKEQNELTKLQTKLQWELAQIPLGLDLKQTSEPHYGLQIQRFIQARDLSRIEVLDSQTMDAVIADAIAAFSPAGAHSREAQFRSTWKKIRPFYPADEQKFIDDLFEVAKSISNKK
jgi:hypothetical protein